LDEVFGVTGAVAATAVVKAAAFTVDASAVVAGWFVAVVWPAAVVTGVFAVVVAVASVVVVGAVVVVASVGSVVTGADAAACAEMACELAAIAAAAIASGAVALPEVGVGAGVLIAVAVTGRTTATGIGVVRDNPACWAWTVGSTAELSSLVEVVVDFVVPVFDVPELPRDCWLEPVPAAPFELAPALLALASEDGPELSLLLLLESLLAGWLACWLEVALFADLELLLAGGVSSARFGVAGGCCCADEAALLASLAVLLSTSPAKMSFPGSWSNRT
jgi:hypothetical protein